MQVGRLPARVAFVWEEVKVLLGFLFAGSLIALFVV